MEGEDRAPLQLHPSGQVDAVFHPKDKVLFTCGADGQIKLFPIPNIHLDSAEAASSISEGLQEPLTCIGVSPRGNLVVTGGHDNSTRAFAIPDGTANGILSRFQGFVHHLAFNNTGSLVASCSDENVIRVSFAEGVANTQVFRGHDGPIMSLAFHPSGAFLYSSSVDGTLRCWDIDTRQCDSMDSPFKSMKNDDHQLMRISWHPAGKYLAVPGPHSALLYEGGRPLRAGPVIRLEGEHSRDVSICSFSPNGLYLATAGLDKTVYVWAISSRMTVEKYKHNAFISSLVWSPFTNSLLVCDFEGKVKVWSEVIAPHLPPPHTNIPGTIVSAAGTGAVAAAASVPELNFDFDDEPDEEEESQNRAKKKLQQNLNKKKEGADGEEGEDGDEDGSDAGDRDEDMDDGVAGTRLDKLRQEYSKPRDKKTAAISSASASSFSGSSIASFSSIEITPFQPNATPFFTGSGGTKSRYLSYSLIGSIHLVASTLGDYNSIEIKFRDASKHKKIGLRDEFLFELGCLTEYGYGFASKSRDNKPGIVRYVPLNAWAPQSDWTLNMPTGEEVNALALGKKFVAIATSRQYLRILTFSGIQKHIISLPGPVVALTSSAASTPTLDPSIAALGVVDESDRLAIVYATASSSYRLLVLNLDNCTTVVETDLVVSPRSQLTWIGFTDHGTVATMDSQGIVRGLMHQFGWKWCPMSDLNASASAANKGKSKDVLLLGILERDGKMVSVPLGKDKRPLKETPDLVPLAVPLIHTSSTGKLFEHEERSLRSRWILEKMLSSSVEDRPENMQEISQAAVELEKTIDKEVVMMIHKSCEDEKLVRALDLASHLRLKKSNHIIQKIAAEAELPLLQERISTLSESFGNYARMYDREREFEFHREQKRQGPWFHSIMESAVNESVRRIKSELPSLSAAASSSSSIVSEDRIRQIAEQAVQQAIMNNKSSSSSSFSSSSAPSSSSSSYRSSSASSSAAAAVEASKPAVDLAEGEEEVIFEDRPTPAPSEQTVTKKSNRGRKAGGATAASKAKAAAAAASAVPAHIANLSSVATRSPSKSIADAAVRTDPFTALAKLQQPLSKASSSSSASAAPAATKKSSAPISFASKSLMSSFTTLNASPVKPKPSSLIEEQAEGDNQQQQQQQNNHHSDDEHADDGHDEEMEEQSEKKTPSPKKRSLSFSSASAAPAAPAASSNGLSKLSQFTANKKAKPAPSPTAAAVESAEEIAAKRREADAKVAAMFGSNAEKVAMSSTTLQALKSRMQADQDEDEEEALPAIEFE